MKQVADGVWQLPGFPPNAINVYLADNVLIDAGTRRSARRILKQLDGRPVRAHALTHPHPDHQGSSDEVCGKLGIEYWVGEKEVPYAERPERFRDIQSSHPYTRLGRGSSRAPVAPSIVCCTRETRSPGSRCDQQTQFFILTGCRVSMNLHCSCGHGAPLRDTQKFVDFVAALPDP